MLHIKSEAGWVNASLSYAIDAGHWFASTACSRGVLQRGCYEPMLQFFLTDFLLARLSNIHSKIKELLTMSSFARRSKDQASKGDKIKFILELADKHLLITFSKIY